jgi:hypothetical protein
LDATTPLAPFYAKTGRLMNSNDVRSITSLGYFYMQLPKTPLTVNTAAAAAVAAAAAAGVDASEAAVAAVSDAVEAVAAAANPAAGADDWASTINSMAPVRTYGWVVSVVGSCHGEARHNQTCPSKQLEQCCVVTHIWVGVGSSRVRAAPQLTATMCQPGIASHPFTFRPAPLSTPPTHVVGSRFLL